jgi:dTDP-glucose pyrophosphorylase
MKRLQTFAEKEAKVNQTPSPVSASLRDVTAVILAGGYGTRLRPVMAGVPKVLAPVLGRPFLFSLLDSLAEAGIEKVVLLTGYQADQVQQTLGTKYRGLTLTYSREPKPLGTAGALRAAAAQIRTSLILLLNGDSYCEVNLPALVEFHRGQKADLCLALSHAEDTSRFGRVEIDAVDRVRGFAEKQAGSGPGWVNAGAYLLDTQLVSEIPDDRPVSLEQEMLPHWLEKRSIRGYRCAGELLDIGTPESYASAEEYFRNVRKKVEGRPAEPPPVLIEFAGWLPAFQLFGNCGQHPQFSHIQVAPEGYRFVSSEPPRPVKKLNPGRLSRWVKTGALAVWQVFRPLVSVIRNGVRTNPVRSLVTLGAVMRLFYRLRRHGAPFFALLKFLRSRHFPSQVMLPARPNLLFLTSIPFTCDQHPWVIEIEDVTTLFFPFIRNGETSEVRVTSSPYFPMVKYLLESPRCRGIITHMRSTAEALPRLFASEVIGAKTTWIPCGTVLPAKPQSQESTGTVDMLFTCSWHQDPNSFFLRGGLEVLRALERLQPHYPNLRLTLRTALPRLRSQYRRILEKCWVRVIDRFLPDREMEELMRSTHIFLLPAARIHVMSVLRAMAYGQVVVASDGWGFEEYVQHGHNGIIVPGRYGKQSWVDPETRMLCEDYRTTRVADRQVVRNLVEAIAALAENPGLRHRLGQQARQDVATKFSLENWNRGLQQALDKAAAAPRTE